MSAPLCTKPDCPVCSKHERWVLVFDNPAAPPWPEAHASKDVAESALSTAKIFAAVVGFPGLGGTIKKLEPVADAKAEAAKLLAALEQVPAADTKPVAWMGEHLAFTDSRLVAQRWSEEGKRVVPLYRHPPKDNPADDVEALKARIATLVEAEARATDGEKAARAAFEKLVKDVHDLAWRYGLPLPKAT